MYMHKYSSSGRALGGFSHVFLWIRASCLSNVILVTFSPMTSWICATSLEMLCITSPVLTSVSKKPISCRSTALRYSRRTRSADLSPTILQHMISAPTNAHQYWY